jgi:DNA topoisomerase I
MTGLRRAISDEHVEAAEAAGLQYVLDTTPGIRRRGAGKGFTYFDVNGQVIKDKEVLKRIRGLVIPPAWRDVWVCPNPRGHLQVTARDAKGRKQYRYHPRYQASRDPPKGRERSGAARHAARQGARDGRAAPGKDLDPRGQG